MMTLLGIAVALTPLAAIVVLLRIVDRIAWRREAAVARQIQLTDAIHRELGAAAAPTVEREIGGGWVVTMRAPLERPGTVAALLRITHRVFSLAGGAPVKIVLTHDVPALYTRTGPERREGRRPTPSLAA